MIKLSYEKHVKTKAGLEKERLELISQGKNYVFNVVETIDKGEYFNVEVESFETFDKARSYLLARAFVILHAEEYFGYTEEEVHEYLEDGQLKLNVEETAVVCSEMDSYYNAYIDIKEIL